MTYGLVKRDITKKLPSTPEELLEFARREFIDSYRQAREKLNALLKAIDTGKLDFDGIVIRAVTGTPTDADPNGSVAFSDLGIFVRIGGVWVGPFGFTSGPATTVVSETAFGQAPAVGASVAFARGDHTHGSPATPVTSLASADGTVTVSPATGAADVSVDKAFSDLADLAQETMLLLRDLVRVEMGLGPESGLIV